ncbi:hypothetical protein D1872_240580 [compost metagenome]
MLLCFSCDGMLFQILGGNGPVPGIRGVASSVDSYDHDADIIGAEVGTYRFHPLRHVVRLHGQSDGVRFPAGQITAHRRILRHHRGAGRDGIMVGLQIGFHLIQQLLVRNAERSDKQPFRHVDRNRQGEKRYRYDADKRHQKKLGEHPLLLEFMHPAVLHSFRISAAC